MPRSPLREPVAEIQWKGWEGDLGAPTQGPREGRPSYTSPAATHLVGGGTVLSWQQGNVQI